MQKVSISNVWRLRFLRLLVEFYQKGYQLNPTTAAHLRLQVIADVDQVMKALDAKGYQWKDLEQIVEDLPDQTRKRTMTVTQGKLI